MTDDLRGRCLVFCGGLERHHGAEDHVAFPFLDERFPELRTALNELRGNVALPAGGSIASVPSASKNGDVVRARAAGAELVKLHDWFRQELALLRAGARTTMTDDLRSRCLVFCGGLERHHGAEDHVAFPFLDERFPELRPALNELRAEHARIEHLRAELNQLVETGTPTPADFDSLAAELTAHLDREERLLVPLLNALPEAPWP